MGPKVPDRENITRHEQSRMRASVYSGAAEMGHHRARLVFRLTGIARIARTKIQGFARLVRPALQPKTLPLFSNPN